MPKKSFHPRSYHNDPYDFDLLVEKCPELGKYITLNPKGEKAINFADAKAIVALNKALLIHHYQIVDWSIPKGHLCPPVPSRADYLHHLADLLSENHQGIIPKGAKIKGLDIGTGTSAIYPLLGHSLFGWKFIGADIDGLALNNVKSILQKNPSHQKHIKTRFQKSPQHIFKNLLQTDERFDFSLCNPPFFTSAQEAQEQTRQKVANLNLNKLKKGQEKTLIKTKPSSNFGGKNAELWCPGGELEFIRLMIRESADFKTQVTWFTTLVSQKAHLDGFNLDLIEIGASQTRTIEMKHGNKIAHLLAWKFS